jgi:phosphoribosylaminoimidazole (AIR) synthetase
MGIGFVLAVEADETAAILEALEDLGESAFEIGIVTKGNGVEFVTNQEAMV